MNWLKSLFQKKPQEPVIDYNRQWRNCLVSMMQEVNEQRRHRREIEDFIRGRNDRQLVLPF